MQYRSFCAAVFVDRINKNMFLLKMDIGYIEWWIEYHDKNASNNNE